MAKGATLLKHPDREQIDRMLIEGNSLVSVVAWLKNKYPRAKRYWKDKMTLSAYRENYLASKVENAKSLAKRNLDDFIEPSKSSSNDIQLFDQGQPLANPEQVAFDIQKTLLDLRGRLVTYLDRLETDASTSRDYEALAKLVNQFRGLVVDWERLFGHKEESAEISISIGEAEESIQRIKRAIRDVLLEMDPNLVPLFYSKLEARLERDSPLEHVNEVKISVDKRKSQELPAHYEYEL